MKPIDQRIQQLIDNWQRHAHHARKEAANTTLPFRVDDLTTTAATYERCAADLRIILDELQFPERAIAIGRILHPTDPTRDG